MTAQTAFQQIIVQLQTINLHLRCLQRQLALSSTSIRLQIRQLHLIQHQLEVVGKMVFLLFGRAGNSSTHRAYLTLTELLQQADQMTTSLLMLTEESAIDPIGVQSCLQEDVIVSDQLQQRIATLAATGLVCST
ncbi:hypothetical protein AB3R30_24280 [Leptolyngbyaceae cyanobacterium UHCC 1019]